MKIIIDNQLAKLLLHDPLKIAAHSLLADPDNHLHFGWSSLLEYLGLGSIFTLLPPFDETQPLFQGCLMALYTHEEKETLFYIFDQLFAENLSKIKALQQLHPASLLQAVIGRKTHVDIQGQKALSLVLTSFEKSLTNNTSNTMHDLILYLAWSRMCVCLAGLFDYQSSDAKFNAGVEGLKECLIESYVHITGQGRTTPSLYRLFETLFYYYMRGEMMETHLPEEWAVLSQSFAVLKGEEELGDCSYIDAIISAEKEIISSSTCYLTLDTPEKISARFAFAHVMINKLKGEILEWNYDLQPKKIISLF